MPGPSHSSENRKRVLPGPGAAPGAGMFEALLAHFSGQADAPPIDPALVGDLRRELERSEFFGADMERLWHMLAITMAKAGGVSGERHEPVRLLNLACGHCEEAAVLAAFFGWGGRPVRQFAMDLRDREIEQARRRYAATERLFRRAGVPAVRSRDTTVEFVADDATRLAGYAQIPGAFDVIFIRHQNLWHDLAAWQRIYAFALERIAPKGGVLLITSYFDREHLQALELLRSLGARIVASERNPHSRALDHPGKSVDRHVAAIRRSDSLDEAKARFSSSSPGG